MLTELVNSEGIDVLSRTLQFAGQRHKLIVHNVANLTTPKYRPLDVNPKAFREALSEAVKERREAHDSKGGKPFRPKDTRQIEFGRESMRLNPKPSGQNVMFHDQNDRDLERIMQDLAENTMVYRQATDFLNSRFKLLQTAIKGRL
jgi:flagellar basal-body rod protein FlgB